MRDSLTVGVPYVGPTAIGWPLLAAEHLGAYDAEDLDVRLMAGSYDELSKGVSDGTIPVIRRGPDADIVLIERGAPIRIVAGIVGHPIGDLITRPGLTRIDELRGATFGVIDERVGSTLHLKTILARAGIPQGEYRLRVYGGSPARYQALLDGQVDGALLSPPTSYRAVAAGMARICRAADYIPDFVSSSIQVNTDFAAANTDLVTRYVRGTIRGIRWLYGAGNREAAVALLSDGGAMARPEAETTYDELILRDRSFPRDGQVRESGLQALLRALRDMGDVTEVRVGPDGYVMAGIRDAALRTMDPVTAAEDAR